MSMKNKFILASIASLSVFVSGCQISSEQSTKAPVASSEQTILIKQDWLRQSYSNYLTGDPVTQHVISNLLVKAERELKRQPVSVLDKSLVPPSGDKKDYISVGPYWWPDESKPDGLPWIQKDGQVNPASRTDGSDKPNMNDMLFQVSTLTLANYYTKQEKYGLYAAKLIDTWFLDPVTGMNPSLSFGQAVPGKSDGRKYGVIETRWFVRLIDDVILLSQEGQLSPNQQSQFKQWISDYLTWLTTDELGVGACDVHNNHGTFCEAQVAAYAWFVGDTDKASKYVNRVFKTRLDKQVEPDGAQPDELSRTRPLHYSLFNLEAYFIAARVADHLGMDMWNYVTPKGISLKQALDFLIPAINKQGHWDNGKDKKMRRARLFYFLNLAYNEYGDEKYLRAMNDLIPLAIDEDRSELVQCLLISPTPKGFTLDALKKMDPTGKKSHYRCYY